MGVYNREAHLIVARILSELYADDKIGEYIDLEFDDKVASQIVKEIKIIIDFHVKESKK